DDQKAARLEEARRLGLSQLPAHPRGSRRRGHRGSIAGAGAVAGLAAGSGELADGVAAEAGADARGRSAEVAEVVELGLTDAAAGDELNLDDAGRVDGPHALDADAVGDLADRERAAGAASLAVDADALENLDAILASLGDPRVDADGISWAEDGD